ncbi:hypothetical protein SASPL_135312 [Salvia splendens]|uniref:Uncharacterized protein n=1 Tax=Salvia splendens TaxID=180675 RepID=A0A8X8WWA6_SALSN|nr:hypothetical protein SASPL_135312 [Salvia splendens]
MNLKALSIAMHGMTMKGVLTDPDHCYCVLLNAHDGAAFPNERKTEQANSEVSSPENVTSHGKTKNSKLICFVPAGRFGFGSLLSLGHSSARTDRTFMKGPGGRGEVEVAVSGILDQSKVDLGPQSPIQISKKGLGLYAKQHPWHQQQQSRLMLQPRPLPTWMARCCPSSAV